MDVPLSLIIPVYNGARYLPHSIAEIAAWRAERALEVIFVDDGSVDGTQRVLAELAPWAAVLRFTRNRGKGHAVAAGMLQARGAVRVFTDADLVYPLPQIDRFVEVLAAGADVAIACRIAPGSRYELSPSAIRYLYTRHVLSRSYNWLVSRLLLPGVHDVQAGLKAFTAAAAENVFGQLHCGSMAFDLEVLARARQLRLQIVELPVTCRCFDDSSTVRIVRDGTQLLGQLTRLTMKLGFRD